jgi:hypothetical protein
MGFWVLFVVYISFYIIFELIDHGLYEISIRIYFQLIIISTWYISRYINIYRTITYYRSIKYITNW